MNVSSRKSRKLKRWMVIVVTALLAVVTTVAVSWGCALWVDPSGKGNRPGVGFSDPEPEAEATYRQWMAHKYSVSGGTIVYSLWLDEDAFWVQFTMTGRPEHSPESVIPAWSGESLRPVVTGTSGQLHSRVGDAWGWPCVAMWTLWRSSNPPRVDECIHGLPLKGLGIGRSGLSMNPDRALPLAIIWQGFLLNTLVYWAVWLLVYGMFVFVVGGARHSLRRRKGRCTHCGYDLQGSANDRCPECGHELAT